ncbi:MAG TPA: MFS transporter [Thiotrichales bacterium]|nr:MFS transporter [Thiotrichales bacterium]
MTKQFLPRTVVVLGLVSFLNDAASEMITPLLPLFLTLTLGAGPAVVGLVEGVAEATASLLKLVSGRLADRGWNHKRLVLGGYGVSNAARPLIGLALSWGWVLGLRFLDRLGKGLRTSPRDALIAAAAGGARRGRAFGFHRALDNAGAMLGPLLAFGLLTAELPLRQVFLWSLLPGVLVILLLLFGLDDTPAARPAAPPPPLRWHGLDRRLRGLILAAGGLALAAVPEAFLVLWATDRGLQLAWVPLIWAAASGVKALVAAPAGSLSDHWGRLPVLLTGWTARIGILVWLAFTHTGPLAVWAGFLAYAASLAFTEGAERALIGDVAPQAQKATAYGLYHMVVGLAALPGAVLFGALWQWVNETTAFLAAAALALCSVLILVRLARPAKD